MTGINVNTGFEVGSANPIDTRQWLSTAEMKNADVNTMPDPYFAINKEDHFLYIFSKTNPISESTGYFTKYTNDGGMTVWKGSEAERDALPEETKADESIIFYTWDTTGAEYKYVVSKTVGTVENMSEADYQALETKDARTIYTTPGHIRVGENEIVSSKDEPVQYIVISDSYGGRNNDGETMTVWEEHLRMNLKATEGTNYFYGWYGGAGFVNGNFLNILKSICGDTSEIVPEYKTTGTPDFTKKTIVLVAGGWNDVSNDISVIRLGIKAFTEYLSSKFSDVELKLAVLAYGDISVDTQHTTAQYDSIEDVVNSYNVLLGDLAVKTSYITNSEYITHRLDIWQSDGYHPNSGGHAWIGSLIANGVISGSCNVTCIWDDSAELTVASGGIMTGNNVGNYGTVTMQSHIKNNQATIKMSLGMISTDDTVALNGFVKIGKVNLRKLCGRDSNRLTCWMPQTVWAKWKSNEKTTSSWSLINVLFRLNRGWLEGFFTAIDAQQWHTDLKVECIYMPAFTVTCDPMLV